MCNLFISTRVEADRQEQKHSSDTRGQQQLSQMYSVFALRVKEVEQVPADGAPQSLLLQLRGVRRAAAGGGLHERRRRENTITGCNR